MPAPTPPTPIAAVPTTPDRNAGEDIFVPTMYTFLDYFAPFKAYLQLVVTYCADAVTWITGLVSSAESSATAAEASRQAADAAANYKGEWSLLSGALPKPAMVANDGAFWRLENNLADVTASEPAPGNSDWTFVSGTRWVSQFTASGTLPANSMCSASATSGAADFTLGAFVANDFFVLSNSPASTQTVRLLNASYTIRGKIGTASAGTNIIIPAGDFLPLRAVSSSVLEIV